MTTPQPGWYDDGSGTQRWWDGDAWTEHLAPASAAESGVPRVRRVPSRRWIIAGAVLGLVATAGTATTILVRAHHSAEDRAQHARSAEIYGQPGYVVNRFLRSISNEGCSRYDHTATSSDMNDQLAASGCSDLYTLFRSSSFGGPGEVEGDTATVTGTSTALSFEAPDCRTHVTFALKKIDDAWRISGYSTTSVPVSGSDATCD